MSDPTVRRRILPALWVLAALAGCSGSPRVAGDAQAADPAQFLERLAPYCNRAFAGRVLHESPAGAEPEWQQALVLDLRCQGSARLIALSVGEDRSRAMQLGQTVEGVRLNHTRHRPDGRPEALSGFGGLARAETATADRVEFPADEASRELFRRHGAGGAADSVWALEFMDGQTLVYEVKRPGHHLRLGFDLANPVPAPPRPWAEAPVL